MRDDILQVGVLPTFDRPGEYQGRQTILYRCGCGGENCPGWHAFFWDGERYDPRRFRPNRGSEECQMQTMALVARERDVTIAQALAAVLISDTRLPLIAETMAVLQSIPPDMQDGIQWVIDLLDTLAQIQELLVNPAYCVRVDEIEDVPNASLGLFRDFVEGLDLDDL